MLVSIFQELLARKVIRKINDYLRLDARISFKLNGKRINQEWALDLQNLSNHKNIYSETFNPRSNQLIRDYETGFLPIFLYLLKF